MKKQVVYSVMVLVTLTALLSANAYAAGGGQDNQQGRRQGPPPEAFELCKDKNAGDTVEITSPRGDKVEGICREINGQMVAFPADMEGRGGPGGQRPQ